MPPTEDNTTRRVGADGETVETPTEATNEVVVASIPGDDESKFVTITLAHPLNERDRVYLGLPADASTEVGQQVKVNKNGAKAVINAGYATVDPEDNNAVRSVLRGESADSGEPTSEPEAEAYADPALNPPQARTTPSTPGPNAPQPGQKAGATGGSQPSAEGGATGGGSTSGSTGGGK